jgi:phosphatidylglycerophosphate synthase
VTGVRRAVILLDSALALRPVLGLSTFERAVRAARRAGASDLFALARGDVPEGRTLARSLGVAWGASLPGDWGSEPAFVVPADIATADLQLGALASAYSGRRLVAVDRRSGEVVGYQVAPGSEVGAALADTEGIPLALDFPFWTRLGPETDERLLRRGLLDSLRRESDGLLARLFDRRVSLLLTRFLVATPVSPNGVTLARLAIGLAAAWLLSRGSYVTGLAGAVLFVITTILDGVDGEIARLKQQFSKRGTLLDIATDNVVYVSVVLGIAVAVLREDPGANTGLLFGALVAGAALTSLLLVTVVHDALVRASAMARFLIGLANGEFSYIVLAFALAGRTDWFLRSAAVGVHAYNALLAITALVHRRRRAGP